MSFGEVAALIRLNDLGRGDFEASDGDTEYGFGFTPLGRLYRIDTRQELGSFTPDHDTASRLTSQLTTKFGRPDYNQLPTGPASWRSIAWVRSPEGRLESREVQSLSVMFQGGFGGPVELWIKLVDFTVLMEDQARLNASPKAKGEEALRF